MQNKRGIRWLLSDLILSLSALFLATALRRFVPMGFPLPIDDVAPSPLTFLAVAIGFPLIMRSLGVYHWRYLLRPIASSGRVFMGAVLGSVLLASVLFLVSRDTSRLLLVYFFFISSFLLVGSRFAVHHLIKARRHKRLRNNCFVVGMGQAAIRITRIIAKGSELAPKVNGLLLFNGAVEYDRIAPASPVSTYPVENAEAMAELLIRHRVGDIIIVLPFANPALVPAVVNQLHRLPVSVRVIPEIDPATVAVGAGKLGHAAPQGEIPAFPWPARFAKRTMDVGLSGVAIVVTLPIMLVIAVAIKLDSGGPVIFRQLRVGENGRLFPMYKFRSMVSGADRVGLAAAPHKTKDGRPIHKARNDSRVTRVGRFLRRFSLDELPQLLNVLLGDMSLVGPRPEIPMIVQHYEPWQWTRFALPQGMTGWWQINRRGDKLMHQSTETDLYYIYNRSLWLDIRILFRTVMAVVRGRGAF